jgi:uncharacterized protein
VMLINMLLSLIVLPMLVWFIRPAFAAREDLIVGEQVDLSRFERSGAPIAKGGPAPGNRSV